VDQFGEAVLPKGDLWGAVVAACAKAQPAEGQACGAQGDLIGRGPFGCGQERGCGKGSGGKGGVFDELAAGQLVFHRSAGFFSH